MHFKSGGLKGGIAYAIAPGIVELDSSSIIETLHHLLNKSNFGKIVPEWPVITAVYPKGNGFGEICTVIFAGLAEVVS
jgi:hypothetical protein